LNRETVTVLSADTKVFDTAYGKVLISQVEAPGALCLLADADLGDTLHNLVVRNNCTVGIANLVDTSNCQSAILVSNPSVATVLSARLREPIGRDGAIRVGRLLQRKTDIVPYILKAQ
jgi:hypothetical protein